MTGRKRALDDLQGEIQELFADLWQVPRFSGLRHGFRPDCDCYRTDDPPTIHVVVEVPGIDPASIDVVASGKTLVIAGTRERPAVAGAKVIGMEIEYGPFQRRLELGEEIDPAGATATYDRGMLKVNLPLAVRTSVEGTVPITVERP